MSFPSGLCYLGFIQLHMLLTNTFITFHLKVAVAPQEHDYRQGLSWEAVK